MNKIAFEMNITKVKKIWVCWSEEYIADSYEDAVDFSVNSGMAPTFGDWLEYYGGYDIEDIFEMTEEKKAKVKAEYNEYVRGEIDNLWEEREIII